MTEIQLSSDPASILIVEDSPTQAERLRYILEREDFRVKVASNGQLALQILTQEPIDVVISDIIMPEMDGYELCRRIKTDSTLKDVSVVLATSLSDPRDVLRALEVGADNFLRKPYEEESLYARIHNIMVNRQLRKRAPATDRQTFYFDGLSYVLPSDGVQALDLLLSTYEAAVQQNAELTRARDSLRQLNETLEIRVHERTLSLGLEIEKRKSTEGMLSEERNLLRAIMDNLPDLIYLKDIHLRYVLSNASHLRFHGMSQESDIVGKSAASFFPAEISDAIQAKEEAILNRKLPIRDMDEELFDNEGQRHIFSTTEAPILDQFGNPRLLVGIRRDVTERWRTEELVKDQLHWTKVTNDILKSLSERNSVDSVLRVVVHHLGQEMHADVVGVAAYESREDTVALRHLFSTDKELVHKLDIYEGKQYPINLGWVRSDLRANRAFAIRLADADTSLASSGMLFSLEDLRNASVRSFVLIPISIDSGQFAIIFLLSKTKEIYSEQEIGFLDGLSETVSISAHNNALYEELDRSYGVLKDTQKRMMERERMNAMGQMASGIAHDINNTLVPITLYVESLLEREEGLSERARRYLSIIESAAHDIERTTMRMRMFYKKREQEEEHVEIDLTTFFRDVIDLTRPRWETMPQKLGIEVRITTDVPDLCPRITGDPSELREALVNLVFNAIDAMPNGGTVTLAVVPNEDSIAIDVTDTGTGMTKEQVEHAFEPFYTTKGEKGTGLGLSMVFGVMSRHAGSVNIQSAEGEGTTVRLVFPYHDEKSSAVLGISSISAPLMPLHVLCVDDDPHIRESLSEVLTLDGHTVTTAKNGVEGLRVFEDALLSGRRFDIVVSDLGMPEMDGKALSMRIKALDAKTPIILLSGWGNFMKSDGEKPETIDRVLGKPPQVNLLRRAFVELVRSVSQEKQI